NAIPLPFKSRLRPDTAAFFARERVRGQNSVCGIDRADQSASLVAVGVLKRESWLTSGGVAIGTMRASRSLPALLAHAYCFSLLDQERNRRMIERHRGVSARVPILEIRFAAGLERLSAILDRIEQTILHRGNATPPRLPVVIT